MKQILRRILPEPLKSSFYIGFLKNVEIPLPVVERYSKIRWLNVNKYRKEGWFADPFIFSVNDNTIELFAEEMIYKTGRGIIVYLKVDVNSFEVIEKHVMLELDTHLSFPIYIRDKGKYYVYPENYQSGTLKIYEFDENSRSLTHPRTIIHAPLLDTQIVKWDDFYYAFGVEYQTGFQKDTKRLNIYKADTSKGIFKVNPSTVFESLGMDQMTQGGSMSMMGSTDAWSEMIDNEDLARPMIIVKNEVQV